MKKGTLTPRQITAYHRDGFIIARRFFDREEMDLLSRAAHEDRVLDQHSFSRDDGTGARVRLSGGKVTVIDGPFTEAKEVIGGYAQFELKSKQEAIESAVAFMELHKKHWPGWEGETEVRQMFEPGEFPCK